MGWAMVRCAPCGAPVNAEFVRFRMGMHVGRPLCVWCFAAMMVDVERPGMQRRFSRLVELYEDYPALVIAPTGY